LVTLTTVEPGAAPGALPITSIVVFPPWRLAVAEKIPLPTAADWPCTCTVADGGSTVARTTTRSAAITLPLVGDVTTTDTGLGTVAPALLIVVVVEPHPTVAKPASTPARTTAAAMAGCDGALLWLL
jgi:hypothetical protein